MWCIAAAPTETPAADALEHCLCGIRDQGVAPQRTLLQLREPLIGLMERLDAMLRGVTLLGPALGAREEDAFRKGRQDGDALIPDEVRAGDVVVLHDPIAAALAPAIRERGGHAIWRTSIGRWEGNATAAWRFLHRSSPALDAYVTAWRSGPTGPPGARWRRRVHRSGRSGVGQGGRRGPARIGLRGDRLDDPPRGRRTRRSRRAGRGHRPRTAVGRRPLSGRLRGQDRVDLPSQSPLGLAQPCMVGVGESSAGRD